MSGADTSLPIPVPTSVHGYRVEGVLGRGASGVVLRVRDPALDRSLALKILEDAGDEAARARFTVEAKAAARIVHPNVVQVFAVGEIEGRPYIVQELVDGLPLSEMLAARGRLSVGAALEVAIQAADGLAAAAAAGVVHRDVKPHNLLLSDGGAVKIADFGVAKLLYAATALTEHGTTLGTPHYMAPEQGEGRAVDARADQYALGATLFHLVAGRPPYDHEDVLPLLRAHASAAIPRLSEAAPADAEVPAALDLVLARMLGKAPEDRYPDFEVVAEALDAVRADCDAEAAQDELHFEPPPPAAPAPARRSFTGLATGLVGLGALAVAGAVLVAGRGGSTETTTPARTAPAPRAAAAAPPPNARDPFARSDEAEAPAEAPSRARRPLAARSTKGLVRLLSGPRAAQAAKVIGARADQSATFALLRALERARDPSVAEATGDALASLADIRALEDLERIAASGRTQEIRDAAQRARRSLYRVEE